MEKNRRNTRKNGVLLFAAHVSECHSLKFCIIATLAILVFSVKMFWSR